MYQRRMEIVIVHFEKGDNKILELSHFNYIAKSYATLSRTQSNPNEKSMPEHPPYKLDR